MSDDEDSPLPRGRKPLPVPREAPASPDVDARIKRRVPASPGSLSGTSPEGVDSPVSALHAYQRAESRRVRRNLLLSHPLMQMQATEGNPGNSVDGSQNSDDDR